MVCVVIDMPINGNRCVVSCTRILYVGPKEGDGATLAIMSKDFVVVRGEPRFPSGIGKRASLQIKIAYSNVGSRDCLWLLHISPIDNGTHVSIWTPGSRSPLQMFPRVLAIEQDRDSLLIGGMCFFL